MQAQLTRAQIDRWIAGPTFEDRVLTIFSIVGRKLCSDEAALIWQQLLVRTIEHLPEDLGELLVRQLIALAPEQARSQQLFQALMTSRRQGCTKPALIFMITSCRRYLDKALALHAALSGRGAHAQIVIGDPGVRVASHNGPVSTLPVSDAYEALTYKVLEGLTHLCQRFGPVAIAKTDDDVELASDFDADRLAGMAAQHQYTGHPWGRVCDRCWHLGKTTAPTPIYSRQMKSLFAYGPLYLLGSRAVEHLVRQWVMYPGDAQGRIYEDRAIGEMLADANIPLHPQSIAQLGGIVAETERFTSQPF